MKAFFDPSQGIISRNLGSPDIGKIGKEKILELAQLEEIMFLLTELGRFPAHLAAGTFYFTRFQVAPAPLVTLVPASWNPAIWAYSLHVPVREEPLTPGTIALLDDLLIHVPMVDETLHDRLGAPMIGLSICHSKVIKIHRETFEGIIKVLVVPQRELPRVYLFFLGAHHDRGPVVVGSTDKNYISPGPTQKSYIKIGRYIGPQMAKVAASIGIGKTAGHQPRALIHP
jgi:hypothetical protein